MSTQTNSFYNKFSMLYPVVDVVLKPQKRILFTEVDKLPAGTVLEIGAGNGSHFSLYKKHRVIAIDTSASMLSTARKRAGKHITVLEMDGQALTFNNESFDYVVLSHVLAVVADPQHLLAEAYRVLKPDGQLFILNHFTPANWLGWVDRAFSLLSKALHFRSLFRLEALTALKIFILVREFDLGFGSYFKLLIFRKK